MEYIEPYLSILNQFQENLDYDSLYKSLVHGSGHIERVLKLGAAIAQNEEFTENETAMLLLCCAYHDIGRVDDRYDIDHGTRSAKKLTDGAICNIISTFSEDDANIIKAAISAHSDIDDNLNIYKLTYNVKDEVKYYKIATCLKDADNLDRVRIGDFNEKYIRHEKSHLLIPYAYKLLDGYPNLSFFHHFHKKS